MVKRIYTRDHFPFVRLLFAWLIGITGGYVITPTSVHYSVLLVLSISCFLVFFLASHSRKWNSYSGPFFLLAIAFFACTLVWKSEPVIQKQHFMHFKTDALIGVIISEPKYTEKYIRFELKVKKGISNNQYHTMNGKLLINLKRPIEIDLPNYGDQLIVQSNYYETSPPYNPGEFNYKRYLSNEEIWHTAFLSENQIQKIGVNKANPIVQFALLLRQKMLKKLELQLTDKSAFLVASALILGYRNDMEKDVMGVFTNTGTVHVLAVSGLHVGIVFVVFSALLVRMNRNRKLKLLKGLLLLLLIWSYALLTGFSPSVLRAAIMISFTLVAVHLVKDINIYNTIAASAFMMLVYNPRFISHVGFQLSYLALLGIIYLYPKVRDLYKGENKVWKWIWSYSSLSIVAQLATFPLVIYYFNNFPLYFLPANLFIILPATLIVYLGFLVLILPFGGIASFVAMVLQLLLQFCISVLEQLSSLPMAKITGFNLDYWQIFFLYSFIASIIFMFIKKKKAFVFTATLSFVVLSSLKTKNFIRNNQSEKIRLYNVNRNFFVGIYNNNDFISYSDSVHAKTTGYHYLLESAQRENRLKRMNPVLYPAKYRKENVLIAHPFIQVKNKRMLILDKKYEFEESLSVDVVLIRDDNQLELKELMKSIHFKKLILDGSNNQKTIKYYVENAENLAIPYYILKNNYAYVW